MEKTTKAEKREAKDRKKRKMKVSGAGVKEVQRIIINKYYSK